MTECENDTGNLIQLKYGLPSWLYNYTIDTHHTPHYATGYLINEVNPRVGMVTHFPFEEDLVAEAMDQGPIGLSTGLDGSKMASS